MEELDDAVQEFALTVGHAADLVEAVRDVGDQRPFGFRGVHHRVEWHWEPISGACSTVKT
ncbi:MAG TPA: hypothetical protein VII33_14805 [Nakamurella sp.]